MILHLIKTDWRRLWPFIVTGWLAMVVMAVPAFRFETGDTEIHRFTGGWIQSAWFSPRWRKTLYLLTGGIPFGPGLLQSYLVAIAAMLGFGGIAWSRTRPLARGASVMAKGMALIVFLVLPQLLIVEAVALRQDLGSGPMVALAVRSGSVIFLLHLLSMLFGRLCGGFWAWLAAVAALGALGGIARAFGPGRSAFVGTNWRSALRSDVWGSDFSNWWPLGLCVIAIGVLLMVFRRRQGTWRIALGCLVLAVLPNLVKPAQPPLGSHPLQSLADWKGKIRVELGDGSNFRPYDAYLGLKTSGTEDGLHVWWMLEKGYPLRTRGGREIPHFKWRREPMGRGSMVPPAVSGGMANFVPLPESKEIPDPNEFMPMSRPGSLYLGVFDPDVMAEDDGRVEVDARLFGVVCRYEKIFELSLGEETAFRETGMQARAKFEATPYPQLVLDWLRYPESPGLSPVDPLQTLRVLLYLPSEDRTYEIGGQGRVESRSLLAEVSAGRSVFSRAPQEQRVFEDGKERVLPLPPPPDLTGAKFLVFEPRVLGKVRARVRSEGPATVPVVRKDSRPFEVIQGAPPGPRNNEINCPLAMPDPETCTLEEASLWLQHLMIYHDRGDWPIQALGPLVPRFPELFLNCPDDPWGPLPRAIKDWLPENRRDDLIEAFGKGGPFLDVIMARGWLEKARPEVMKRFPAMDGCDDKWAAAVCRYEDPATYPKLVGSLAAAYEPGAYYSIRELPGIGPLLDPAMEAIAADLVARKAGDGHDSYYLRRKLMAPAVHGIQPAFARLWELWRIPRKPFGWGQHLREMAEAIGEPAGLGDDKDKWKEFHERHSAEDFEYDPLAAQWRLKNPEIEAESP
ncbi:hypothetical protein [Luteolibacter marinus]|uniref:hypothetical protein n=1 Tax=Luteolibacter marinus TaxID=2776705 RepID=UPI00186645CA|nr:hypothetical protein [Luteolibacter marinus]